MTVLAILVIIGGAANILLAVAAFKRPDLVDPRQLARRWTNLCLGGGFILMGVAFLTSPGGRVGGSPWIWPASALLAAGMLTVWNPWKRG